MKHLFTLLAWAVPAVGVLIACAKKPAKIEYHPAVPTEWREDYEGPPPAAAALPALALDLPGDVTFYFPLDSDSLEDVRQADALASQLAHGDLTVTLTGHACPLGSDAYNQALSLRRAMALAVHLERAGVPAWRLKVEALGESRPVARAPREYWKNRRVNVAFSIGVR